MSNYVPTYLANHLASASWVKDKPGGVAVAWVDRDGTQFFQAGRFAADDPRPITADTQFEIGSITKVFTGLLLAESEKLRRVQRGAPTAMLLLPANDPAQAALADITLAALATHSAGLPRLPFNLANRTDADPYADYDRVKLIEALRYHGPSATVGERTAYSNFGAGLLGEALAAAWGTSYTEALRAQVLTPLGMNETTVGLTGAKPPENLAPGHNAQGQRTQNWEFAALAPAGALRSSTRELARLLEAALGRQETPLAAALAESVKPVRASSEIPGSIGLGWMITPDTEHPAITWHNGRTGGYTSFLGFCAATGQGIAILTNQHSFIDPIGFHLLGAKAPGTAPSPGPNAVPKAPRVLPEEIILPEETLREYTGAYPLSPRFIIAITREGGALFAQATNQPRLALFAEARDKFFLKVVDAQISFTRDDGGAVTGLVLHQNSRNQPAKKSSDH